MSKFYIALIFFLSTTNGYSQNKKEHYFLGINPSLTVEPYYAKGEFDLNILPLVVQKMINSRSGIRLISLVNLGFKNSAKSISHIGLSGGWVYYLSQQEQDLYTKQGIYVAPVLALSYNRFEKSFNTGLYAETGYHFLLPKNWGIATGLQFGYTHFNYSTISSDTWKTHFGIKVIIGKWK